MQNMNKKHSRFEQGQAMMEYAAMVPIAITIFIFSSGLTAWLNGAYQQAVDGFDVQYCNNAYHDPITSSNNEGEDALKTTSIMGNHLIQLVGKSYNASDDTTTIVYEVTSGSQPSISHWVLGLNNGIASQITDQNEVWEWTASDPTTHIAGIKFDEGYEGGSGGGKPDKTDSSTDTDSGDTNANNNAGGNNNDDKPGNSGNAGPKKKGRVYPQYNNTTRIILVNPYRNVSFADGKTEWYSTQDATSFGFATGESRTIAILLSGQYDFEEVAVTIKAGTDTYEDTIAAPVAVKQSTDETTTDTASTAPEGCGS